MFGGRGSRTRVGAGRNRRGLLPPRGRTLPSPPRARAPGGAFGGRGATMPRINRGLPMGGGVNPRYQMSNRGLASGRVGTPRTIAGAARNTGIMGGGRRTGPVRSPSRTGLGRSAVMPGGWSPRRGGVSRGRGFGPVQGSQHPGGPDPSGGGYGGRLSRNLRRAVGPIGRVRGTRSTPGGTGRGGVSRGRGINDGPGGTGAGGNASLNRLARNHSRLRTRAGTGGPGASRGKRALVGRGRKKNMGQRRVARGSRPRNLRGR